MQEGRIEFYLLILLRKRALEKKINAFYLSTGNKGKLDGLRTWNAFKQESCVMGNVANKKSAP